MSDLNLFAQIGTYALMLVSVLAAIGIVTLKNLFHSALALALVLIGMAGIFIGLQADFLAMVQILIYVGAVMTLVIFAIMLTHRLGDKAVRQNNKQSLVAAAGLLLFLGFLIKILLATPWPIQNETLQAQVTTMDLGQALLGPYVFPFEVISVVLISVLIGAIVIARKD